MKPVLAVVNEPALDRPLPHSDEQERAVLGAILIDPENAYPRVAALLSPEEFFRNAHVVIFEAMCDLAQKGLGFDLLTLKDELARRGQIDLVGGSAYISSLVDGIPDVANVARYARGVKGKAQLRRLVTIGNDLMNAAAAEESAAEDLAADAATSLQLIQPSDADEAVLSYRDITASLEALYLAGGIARGALTGFPSLDEFYTVARGAWTLVTGIPGHGKSGFLDALAINLARKHDWQVVMFSAENFPPESHVASLIEKFVGKPFNDGPTTRMNVGDVARGHAFLQAHFRFINPAAEGMTIDRLLGLAAALHERRAIDVLVIDPWNELHHDRDPHISETEFVSVCLTKIRRWARKNDAHVYLVAHPQKMQKDKQTGQYGIPTPYDVSGSAHWRNKADYCLTVWRDITQGDDDPNVSIFVQKARRREIGRLGKAQLTYDRVTGEYIDPQAQRKYREFYT